MALEYQTPITIAAPEEALWQRAMMLIFVWAPLGLFFTAIAGVVTGLAFTFLGVVVTPILGLFCAYAIYRLQKVRRHRRAMLILSYLETATRLNLPLNEYLLAAELSERGAMGARLHDIRDLVARGLPISTAVNDAVPEMPASVVATMRVGESLGQLQPTLRRLVNDVAMPALTPNERLPFYRFYGVGLCVIAFNMMAGYMYFILPKFREIFRDMRAPVPREMQFMIDMSNVSRDLTPVSLAVFVLVSLLFLGFVGGMLERAFMLRRESERRRTMLDRIMWHLPVIGRMNRARSLGEVCNVLAESTRAGVPLPVALDRAEGLNINHEAKQQLMLWQHGVASGKSPADAAQEAGMPELVVGLMNPAQERSGTETESAHAMTGVFDFLARYYRGQFSRILIALQAAGEPVLVILLGILVAWLMLSVISPLSVLIQTMMKPPWWDVL